VFLNARTTGDGNMQLCPTIFKNPNASSTMALTRPETTINLHGVAKQTIRLILLTLRRKKANCVYACSSAPTVMKITKQTPIYVHSEGIDSIVSSTLKSTMRSVKTG